MKILLLGYGKEGQALENYFKSHKLHEDDKDFPEIEIWQNFAPEELLQKDYSPYDIIFRSPSVPPLHFKNESSVTKYFFDHCPCQIIGVTATKGKGTTCSFIYHLLKAHGEDVYLVGNIGEPAINALDQLKETSIVVYEMSSFQLWDLEKSPHVACLGTIEPDHLNVHKDYNEYKNAKANICRHQTTDDYLIYYQKNPESVKLADTTKKPHKIPYPFEIPDDVKNAIKIPGMHNQENAIAAIATVASYLNISPDEYLQRYKNEIIAGLSSFHGLPHRLEFVHEIDNIKFYDDNFSTNTASTKVALTAFPGEKIIPIIGGLDKTDYQDLPELYEILNQDCIPAIVLIGESGREFMNRYQNSALKGRLILADSLKDAITTAYAAAKITKARLVVMSPAAASFDMFKNVYDRGDQYKKIIKNLVLFLN